MVAGRLGRKYLLLLSLSLLALLFLLLLTLDGRLLLLQRVRPLEGGGGEVGFLRRRMSYDDEGGGRDDAGAVAEGETKDLALKGILLAKDADEGAKERGVQHDQWLKEVDLQHEEFLRRQQRLQEQHLLEAQALRRKVQEEEKEKDALRKQGEAVKEKKDALRRQGEAVLRQTLKREYASVKKDVPFTPGEPVDPRRVRRAIVVSTWRSGSSYLGDLLRAYPGAFYSFEPLHHLLKNQHLQEGPLVARVLSVLRGILTCDYGQLQDYVDNMLNHTFLMDHNVRIWNSCAVNRSLCFDRDHLSSLCGLMPFNVLKTVRMGLSPLLELLRDPGLDLRVVHLVRDPRGTLHSRRHLAWCVSQVCRDPATVCKDLLTDLSLSDWLRENFPDRYLLVRYEDLSLRPEEKARDIFDFLQLSYNKYVASFVKEHTRPSKKTKKNGTYSTFRDSKATAFAWRGSLNYTSVEAIQDACVETLQRLHLRIFENEEEYLNTTLPVLLSN